MQVGDLVKYKVHYAPHAALGLVLQTPEQTNKGDYKVLWTKDGRDFALYCRGELLEIINANR